MQQVELKLVEAEASLLHLEPGDVLFVRLPEGDWEPEMLDGFAEAIRAALDKAGRAEDVGVVLASGEIRMEVVRPPTAELATVAEPLAVRLTRFALDGSVGRQLVLDTVTEVRLDPTIVEGRSIESVDGFARYVPPDRCVGFRLRLALWEKSVPMALGGDERLERMFTDGNGPVALEMWTRNLKGSGQDPDAPWTHFLFQSTRWEVAGPGIYIGACDLGPLAGAEALCEDAPDGEPVKAGWWLTATPPPG